MKKNILFILMSFVIISAFSQRTPRGLANKLINSLNNEDYNKFKKCFVTIDDINSITNKRDKENLLDEYEDIDTPEYIKTTYNHALRDIGFNKNSQQQIKIDSIDYDIEEDGGLLGTELSIIVIYKGKKYDIDVEYCVFLKNQWVSVNEIDVY